MTDHDDAAAAQLDLAIALRASMVEGAKAGFTDTMMTRAFFGVAIARALETRPPALVAKWLRMTADRIERRDAALPTLQ